MLSRLNPLGSGNLKFVRFVEEIEVLDASDVFKVSECLKFWEC